MEWVEIITNPADVLNNTWDYHHFKTLHQLAKEREWRKFVSHLAWCDTYLQEQNDMLPIGTRSIWQTLHDSNAQQRHDSGPVGVRQNPTGGGTAVGARKQDVENCLLLKSLAAVIFPHKKKTECTFTKAFPTPKTWTSGFSVRGVTRWWWTISWKKAGMTNECWICSLKTLITGESQFSIWLKTCFPRENSPRPSTAMFITWWLQNIRWITRECAMWRCKPFPSDSEV